MEAPEPSRGYISSSDNAPGSDPVIEVFKNALIDYKAQVQVVDSTRKIPGAIAKALEDSSSIVVPEGLDKQWLQKLQKKQIHIDSLDKPLSHHALDQINAVVTSSRCAVSHTGTIMLDGTPDQGRRAISLVPDTHVCVVFASTVYPTVPQAVKVLSRHPLRACTWIAGPSATSDIELIRVDGVHGPRNLHVIIVRD
ncbi:MAG: lactate utilization protein C [Actinomycetaceae bacterium]|nr:lactate utilization protein C [Actinomycetaceae bacterium]